MVRCKICKEKFAVISNTHLRSRHGLTVKTYTKCFGDKGVGFVSSFSDLPKSDPRYARWYKSLLRRPPPWSKGYTKETHPSVAKISSTFKKRRIDNFAAWRAQAKAEGRIPSSYPPLEKNQELAFLIGMVLGDGHIQKFSRTESLNISLGTDKPDLWQFTERVVKNVFNKDPHVYKVKSSACMVIRLYQKKISARLGIPEGNRGKIKIVLPQWIWGKRGCLIACVRGLYEAEGSFCVHEPTYTYKMLFSNKNDSLLNFMYTALEELGFHPHRSPYKIQISRKQEAYALKEQISFRNYSHKYS